MLGTFLNKCFGSYGFRSSYSKASRAVRPLCSVIGHDPQGKVQPVWSGSGPFLIPPNDPRTADYTGYDYAYPDGRVEHVAGCVQPHSGIIYFMRECSRCKRRIPVDEADARNKSAKTAEISAIMNGSRAQYGLAPISWDE